MTITFSSESVLLDEFKSIAKQRLNEAAGCEPRSIEASLRNPAPPEVISPTSSFRSCCHAMDDIHDGTVSLPITRDLFSCQFYFYALEQKVNGRHSRAQK